MPINNNGSTFAGAGYLFACGLGAEITAAATIEVSDGVHVISGSASIATINGGQRNPNICYLVKKAGASWSLASGGNIIDTGILPYSPSPDVVVTLLWDGSSWRIAAVGQRDYGGSAATAYGDSIMLGVGLAATEGIVPTIAAATGWNITNAAVSGSLLQEPGQADAMFAAVITADSRSLLLTGYNDMRAAGTTAVNIASYRGAVAALAAWLAIPEANKLRGTNAAIVYTGTWTNASAYGGNTVKVTTTGGDTAVASVQGTAVYVGAVALSPSTGGTFSVTVDGINYGTYSCNNAVLSPNLRNYAPFLVRVANLPNTKHSVTVTQNGAGQIFIAYIASNNVPAASTPSVLIANCLRMNATGYTFGGGSFNHGSDTSVGLFNAAIKGALDPLVRDGLNIGIIDTSPYNPDVAANIQTDNIHPSATGAALLASLFLRSAKAGATTSDHNPPAQRAVAIGRAGVTVATQTINSGTPAALTGATYTFLAPFDGVAEIAVDMDVQQTGAGLFIADLYSGGVVIATSGRIGYDPQTVNARAALSHTWYVAITGGVSYTFALYAATAGAGSFDVYGSNAGNANTGFVITAFQTS